MTQAEKDGHVAMLNEAERAALKAIDRVQADGEIDLTAERQKVQSAFFQMRDRVQQSQLTKD